MSPRRSHRFSISVASQSRCVLLILCLLVILPWSAYASDEIVYYHNDILGSPIAATDAQGSLLWQEDYQPYGERLHQVTSGQNNLWYTGKLEETDLGINYFGARWYDPSLGRFMAVDPAGFNENNPHSFNRYNYANNNPLTFVDPNGKNPVAAGIVVGLVILSGGDVSDTVEAVASVIPGVETIADSWEFASGLTVTGDTGDRKIAAAALALPIGAFALKKISKVGGEVLLDSNVVPLLKKDPTLGGRLRPGEQGVVSFVTRPELRNVVTRGRGLRGVPRALDDLPVLGTRPSVDSTINLRGQLNRVSGRFADGVIGGQAIDLGIPLITNDRELAGAVRALGGTVR